METPNCLICNEPLQEPEIRLNRAWHFDCTKCYYCHDSDGIEQFSERVVECLEKGIPVSHKTCHQTACFQDFRNKVLPITKAHIDALNSQICSFFPATSPETSDVKTLYDLLISLQETATNVSHVLALTKDKLLIRESRVFSTEQKQKAEKLKAERIESETEKLAAQARTEMFKAERENPALRHRRKAIEAFTAIGMSEADAIAMVDKQSQPKGPVQ